MKSPPGRISDTLPPARESFNVRTEDPVAEEIAAGVVDREPDHRRDRDRELDQVPACVAPDVGLALERPRPRTHAERLARIARLGDQQQPHRHLERRRESRRVVAVAGVDQRRVRARAHVPVGSAQADRRMREHAAEHPAGLGDLVAELRHRDPHERHRMVQRMAGDLVSRRLELAQDRRVLDRVACDHEERRAHVVTTEHLGEPRQRVGVDERIGRQPFEPVAQQMEIDRIDVDADGRVRSAHRHRGT